MSLLEISRVPVAKPLGPTARLGVEAAEGESLDVIQADTYICIY